MKAVCKICGRSFETLIPHLKRAHGLTVDEYKIQFPGSKLLSDEYKDKQSRAMIRRNTNKEFSESISVRNSNNWKNKEYREKQVLAMIKKRNHSIKGYHYSSKCRSFVAYKSLSELMYAQQLDDNSDVVSYDSESFVIWYQYQGEDKIYVPDFIVTYKDNHTEVVEIKPEDHHSAHDELLQNKYLAAEKYCKLKGYIFIVIKG